METLIALAVVITAIVLAVRNKNLKTVSEVYAETDQKMKGAVVQLSEHHRRARRRALNDAA